MSEKAMFGAGCFWGVEASFRKIKGVSQTAVGYAGGALENPTYEDVCTGKTGHAEVVLLEFDPAVVSYATLLEVFWSAHDPTQIDRQGPDVGTQYRSAIFFFSSEQENQANASKSYKEQKKAFPRPIATEITAAPAFYKAEDYHQQYLEKRGLFNCH